MDPLGGVHHSPTEEWEAGSRVAKRSLSRIYSSSRSIGYLSIPVNAKFRSSFRSSFGTPTLRSTEYSKIWRGDADQDERAQ